MYVPILGPILVSFFLQEVSTVKLGRLVPTLLTAFMRNRGTDPLLSFKNALVVLGLVTESSNMKTTGLPLDSCSIR